MKQQIEVRSFAEWIGMITYAANRWHIDPGRDSEASAAMMVTARELKVVAGRIKEEPDRSDLLPLEVQSVQNLLEKEAPCRLSPFLWLSCRAVD